MKQKIQGIHTVYAKSLVKHDESLASVSGAADPPAKRQVVDPSHKASKHETSGLCKDHQQGGRGLLSKIPEVLLSSDGSIVSSTDDLQTSHGESCVSSPAHSPVARRQFWASSGRRTDSSVQPVSCRREPRGHEAARKSKSKTPKAACSDLKAPPKDKAKDRSMCSSGRRNDSSVLSVTCRLEPRGLKAARKSKKKTPKAACPDSKAPRKAKAKIRSECSSGFQDSRPGSEDGKRYKTSNLDRQKKMADQKQRDGLFVFKDGLNACGGKASLKLYDRKRVDDYGPVSFKSAVTKEGGLQKYMDDKAAIIVPRAGSEDERDMSMNCEINVKCSAWVRTEYESMCVDNRPKVQNWHYEPDSPDAHEIMFCDYHDEHADSCRYGCIA